MNVFCIDSDQKYLHGTSSYMEKCICPSGVQFISAGNEVSCDTKKDRSPLQRDSCPVLLFLFSGFYRTIFAAP